MRTDRNCSDSSHNTRFEEDRWTVKFDTMDQWKCDCQVTSSSGISRQPFLHDNLNSMQEFKPHCSLKITTLTQ